MRRLLSGTPLLAVLALTLLFSQGASAQVTYLVTVNTSSLAGSGYLDFQFNPGISSQAATATVSAINPEGSLSSSPTLSGNVTGLLPPSITLANGGPYNDYFVGWTSGGSLNYLVTFAGPAISAPSPTYISGSSFGFGMYAGDGTTSQLSTDPLGSGFSLTINVNPGGGLTVNHLSPNVDVVVSPNTQIGEGYVTNSGANSVSVLDTSTNTVKKTIPVGVTPLYVVISPDGTRAYVANSGSHSVSVIDTSTNTVIATVQVGNSPYQLAVSSDGSRLYVANNGSNSVSVIGTANDVVVATVAVGHSPASVTISADGREVFVADSRSSALSVINTTTNTVIATVGVGSLPTSMAAH